MALRVEQKASGLTFEVGHGCLVTSLLRVAVSGLILLASAGTRDLDRALAVEQHPALVATSLTSDQERALRPGDEFRECPRCPVMVVLPIGAFTMGAPDDLMISGPDMWGIYPNERPAHLVTISYPLAIGKYEVTFTEWEACVAADGCDQIADDGGFGRGERPAVNISWDDASRYLDWLSKLTGKTYRLPSEAEWEYAARAESSTLYCFGDDEAELSDYAWYIDNAGSETHPVGKKKPNDFGVYDAHGNAGEWVEDPWHDWYVDAPSDGSVWTKDGDSTSRIVRGGSMYQPHWGLYSMRRAATERNGQLYTGFRAVRPLDQ